MFAVATAFAAHFSSWLAARAEDSIFGDRRQSGKRRCSAVARQYGVTLSSMASYVLGEVRQTASKARAALFSDTLLPLDELGVASAQEVGNIVYSLASGIGKQRAQRDGSPRPPNTWRVTVLSTGELSISDKIREAGGRVRAGQEVRILDIDADAGKGCGVFDHGGPDGDPGKLASAIKEAAVTYYGTAGPAFVKAVYAAGVDEIASDVRAAQDVLTERIAAGARNGQVLRAARRFALSGVAGELAIQLGVLPWTAGAAAKATEVLFANWWSDRGDDPGEIRGAIEQIRTLLERYGNSRFDPVNRPSDTRPVPDRLGWVRGDGDNRQWLIPPGVWRGVFCQGFDPKIIARALADRGILTLDGEGKFSRCERVDGKPMRVYVVSPMVRADDSKWGAPMIDLRSRLLAAVMRNGLKEDVGNPKSRCNGVTAFNSLQNSVVTLSSPVTPESSCEITAVTPSHPNSTDREAQEQNRVDPKENSPGWPYGRALAALRERCPERVEEHQWELAVMDAGSFVTRWGERAATLGWITNDLFGLADGPLGDSLEDFGPRAIKAENTPAQ